MAKKAKKKEEKKLSLSDVLWNCRNALRGVGSTEKNRDAVIGLTFLKFASNKFEKKRQEIINEYGDNPVFLEKDSFYRSDNVFYLPEHTRWSYIKANASKDNIATILDEAMKELEERNEPLAGALLRNNFFVTLGADKSSLKKLIDEIDKINPETYPEEEDLIGRVYEYFLQAYAVAAKKEDGEIYTPACIVQLIAELIEPYSGTVYDPCCGSGGMFVQSLKFVDKHKGNRKEISVLGQESNPDTWRLCKMNLAIRGIAHDLGQKNASTFTDDQHKDKTVNYIMANPPYNAKPINIPEEYKFDWGKAKNGKEDPTKGLVFVHYLSDVIKEMNNKREQEGLPRKFVKMAVLLPVAVAIGTPKIIQAEKTAMLEENTLEAVFTLPNEIFYPGASASACCMVFTLGEPHIKIDGTVKETFFGYYKEDGFKKKKNLGRVEQFDENGDSKWKSIEEEWLKLFRNHKSVDGLSATAEVSATDEWLCEAYMKTDYSTLSEKDFQKTLNNYLSYLIKEGKIYES